MSVSPAHFSLEAVIRPNILALQPYRCARDDYKEGVLLDANENALGHSIPRSLLPSQTISTGSTSVDLLESDLHRYPDPSHDEVKSRIAHLRGLPGPEYIFLGVGSDECIDLLMRICCAPARDKILITPPTYGMYSVCAHVNEVDIVKVPLDVEGGAFAVKVDEVHKAVSADKSIKLVFLTSPGNPTGTLVPLSVITAICEDPAYNGIVVVDEAYIDFAGESNSAASLIAKYANLVVMQTLSKGFGLASIRVGAALAQPALIQILTNTKAPYNISGPTAHLALAALSPEGIAGMQQKASQLITSRASVIAEFDKLQPLGLGHVLGGNHANFVMLPILKGGTGEGAKEPDNTRAQWIYKNMAEQLGVVVRYRGGEYGCKGCLRVTIGSPEENKTMLARLEESLRATLPE
ncbi:histidinol-phosphate aminotransferase [Clavulina sp. PMI_390]|nr:histidinol-phosphate aminotransferase [Clavulina sp. PMI_390]